MITAREMNARARALNTAAQKDAARRNGKLGGRPPKLTEKEIAVIQKLKSRGVSYREIASIFSVCVSTVIAHCR